MRSKGSVGATEQKLKTLEWEKNKIDSNTECFACKQTLSKETKDRMKKENLDKIVKAKKEVDDSNESLENADIEICKINPIRDKLVSRKNDLELLIHKLETRLKQKEFKYTQKDIEIVQSALKELDRISSNYLVRSIKVLEPIINSVLEKIDFKLEFDVDGKNKLDIRLFKGYKEFNYKDLSAGQKLLLQIAFKLALLLERGQEGIIIADEGFSSLDRENLLHVLRIFEQYPFQLVMVLHHFSEIPGGIKIINLDITNGKV